MKRTALLAVMLHCLFGFAQQEHAELAVGGSYMMTHNASYTSYNTFGFGIDASWWWRMTGDEWWMQRRRQPSFGIKGSYKHIPGGIAGDMVGVAGLLRSPLLAAAPWLEWDIGLGLSCYTKSSRVTGNQDNIFISSALNCLIDVGLTAHAGEHLAVGTRLLHTSNGMLSRPNQGLNYLQLDMGLKLGDSKRGPIATCPDTVFRRAEVGLTLSPGLAMTRYEQLYDYYFCYDLSLNYLHYVDPAVAVGATVDLWYNFADVDLMPRYVVEWPVPVYVSLMPTVEDFWGPVSLKAGVGYDLLVSKLVRIRLYERVGAYYNFGRQYVGVAMHAHAGQIEFIEWSWGVRFAAR